MKVVLFSVIMVIVVHAVYVSPMCTRVSTPNCTKRTRRHIPVKGEKYSTRLNTDDPFSEQHRKGKRLHELPIWKTPGNVHGRKMTNSRGDPKCKMKRNYKSKTSSRRYYGTGESVDSVGKLEMGKEDPVLRFRSPEQLQEYLFSEAANARHILRGGPALYGVDNRFGRDEHFPRNLDYADSYGERKIPGRRKETYSNFSRYVEPDWRRDRSKCRKSDFEYNPIEKPREWKNKIYGPVDKYWFSGRRNDQIDSRHNYKTRRKEMLQRDGNLQDHPKDYFFPSDSFPPRNDYYPLDVPYLYPPPGFGPRTPFFVPRIRLTYPYDRKLYETPSEHPKMGKEKKEDVPVGSDLAKLKQMVDELDAMSEDVKEMSVTATKSDGERKDKEKNDTVADIKDKLDKIIIPILNKISKDLNGTANQTVNTAKKIEFVESDTKREKDKERDTKDKERDAKDKENKDKDKEKDKDKDKEKDREKDVDAKKDYPCKIDGIWTGTSEALQLNISTLPNMTVKVSIVSENTKKGSDISKDWTINGLTLASFGGPFMFAAVYPEKKKLANFIGQCRTCREEDIIFGLWTFSTAGRDCAEMFTTVETKIDVFRREKTQQTKIEKSSKALTES